MEESTTKTKEKFLFRSEILKKIKKIVRTRQANLEKITITKWIFDACQEKINRENPEFKERF